MANISTLADYLSISPSTTRRRTDPLSRELSTLAELGRAASSAEVCVIGWQAGGAPALVRAPARAPDLEAFGRAGFAQLASQLQLGPNSRIFRVRAPELAASLGSAPVEMELAAATASHESTSAIAVLMTPPDRHPVQVESILELLTQAALGAIAADLNASARDFWKQRAQALEAELVTARHRANEAEAAGRRIEAESAAIALLKPGELPAEIGRLAASAGPFEAWIVALPESGRLRVEAASPPWSPPLPALALDAQSALFDSFSRATPVSRLAGIPPGAPYREDRIFPRSGFAAYLCLPFASGVIALAARAPIEPAAAARATALAARLAPIIDAWTCRRELRTQHALVQSLALRLFGAIDAERARIARDLHDDQAQLLAASRIALEAPRRQARQLLRKIERTLRARLRDLRPATMGRATLQAALEGEVQRLKDAGLDARLLRIDGVRALSRPLQHVCWQVAREAVSNIIRHARAKHAELSLERAGDCARLKVLDDGRGARGKARRAASVGLGLSGLAERVALIGGTLRVDSQRDGTCVTAEIPALTAMPTARKRQR